MGPGKTAPSTTAARGFDWRALLGGVAATLSDVENARAARRGSDELERGQEEIARKQEEADKLLGDELAQLQASNAEAERVQSLSDYTVALRRGRQRLQEPSLPSNLGGARFQADAPVAAQKTAGEARVTSDLMSRIDAPTRQREREGQSAARTASSVGDLGRQAGTAQFLANLRARRQRANPWAALLAQLGTSIAQNYEPRAGATIDPNTIRDMPVIDPNRRNA